MKRLNPSAIGNGQRVGSDYGEGRALYGPNKGFYPGTFVINKPDYWTSHRTGICSMMYYFCHRKLYLSDSGNVMTIDKPIPLADAQISATVFGINGGPVMLGDDIDRMDEDRLLMVRQSSRACPKRAAGGYVRLRGTRLSPGLPPEGRARVGQLGFAGRVQPGRAHACRRPCPLSAWGSTPKPLYSVFDFWNLRFQGVETSGAVSVEVPAGQREAAAHRCLSRPSLAAFH